MPRGGKRAGTQGQAYGNRTDLNTQPVRVPPSRQYGQGEQLRQAQEAIPLPQVVPLDAPTQRPDEHPMAGSPMGPGPGPEAIAPPPHDFTDTGVLTPRDRLQVMLQAGQAAGQDVDDLALLLSRLRS